MNTLYNIDKKYILFAFLSYKFTKLLTDRNTIKYFLTHLPYLSEKTTEKLKEVTLQLEDSLNTPNYIPKEGLKADALSKEEIIKLIEEMPCDNKVGNRISGIIYKNDSEHVELINYFYNKYSLTNPLHPDIYSQIRIMEIEVINFCKSLYKAPEESCGNMTYGGTESILLACYAYREYGKKLSSVCIFCNFHGI